MRGMRDLHDFRKPEDVDRWLKRKGVEPGYILGKKALSIYRQKYQTAAEGLDWTSHDFDLIRTPLGFNRLEDRMEMVSEYALLSWLKGRPLGLIDSAYEFLKVGGYSPLKPWLRKMGIDPRRERDVEMRALVTELKRGNIPESVEKAIDLGIEVRKYEKYELGSHQDQTRSGVIKLENGKKIVYNVFRWLDVDRVIPGIPQNADEGEWIGLAYSGRPAEEFSEIWEDGFARSKDREQVYMEKPEPGHQQLRKKRDAIEFLRKISIV